MDELEHFKVGQRQAWATFSPFELVTSTTAPRLVGFAGVRTGQRVLRQHSARKEFPSTRCPV